MIYIFYGILVLNILWFGAACWYFSIKSRSAAKILVPREERTNTIFPQLAWSLKFLGGMNGAFAIASLALLVLQGVFSTPQQRGVLLLIFAIAHTSQFIFNLPIALKEGTAQKPLWDVLRGPMMFIFITDGTLAFLNGIYSIFLLLV